MKISYNWLKWYIPEAPEAEKLADIFTYHVAEVESFDKTESGDYIFDIKILPNRAHDLLSHQGIAKEVASLLDIAYADPTSKYKIPEVKSTELKIKVESDKCRRYMGRIVRNVKIGPSPSWVVDHLESIGQRGINNAVDAANLVMYDCSQPIHCFDLDKVSGALVIREAREGEEMTTLDNKLVKLATGDLVIADEKNVLAIAGVKGGKIAEVNANTKNIIIEVANFDPTSVRKTAQRAGIFTDARKRFENDLSPTLCDFAMLETSGLMIEYGITHFEDVVDVYPHKQAEQKLKFSKDKVSRVLGEEVSLEDIAQILKRYNISFTEDSGEFEITVPPMRLDLTLEEDMAEEIGRILGYDKVKPKLPKINFKTKVNETFAKISYARNKLLNEGYSEVMTYAFRDTGEVEVLASASDKKFLRTNLKDGLTESIKLNTLNAPLLNNSETKVFEIGAVFGKSGEEIHVAYGDKKKVTEMSLSEFASSASLDASAQDLLLRNVDHSQKHTRESFSMWSLFPFIARDVAVWVGENTKSEEVAKVIKENAGDLVVRGPELFDEFKKGDKVSFALRIVFQSDDRTLTDAEINEVMDKVKSALGSAGWEVR